MLELFVGTCFRHSLKNTSFCCSSEILNPNHLQMSETFFFLLTSCSSISSPVPSPSPSILSCMHANLPISLASRRKTCREGVICLQNEREEELWEVQNSTAQTKRGFGWSKIKCNVDNIDINNIASACISFEKLLIAFKSRYIAQPHSTFPASSKGANYRLHYFIIMYLGYNVTNTSSST